MASTQIPSSEQTEKAERGTQHPTYSLAAAVPDLEALHRQIAFGVASRDTAVQSWGYSSMSGRASSRLGAQSHFGFVDRVGKGSLRISALGRRVLLPTTTDERISAIADAARSPTLYKSLIDRYKGHALPTLLANILVREFGVHSGSAENAARAFRESMEFAGLLRNGVIYDEPGAVDDVQRKTTPSVGTASSNESQSVDQSGPTDFVDSQGRQSPPNATQRYSIPLDAAGRLAEINIPVPVTPRDLARIEAWLKYAKSLFDEGSDVRTPDVSSS